MTTFFRSRLAPLLGVLLLWSALAPLAAAQQTRTLTIRDGTIYVDGQKLSANQVPSDLDLDGMTAQYQFVGIQRPVIELNGRLFAVRNGLKKVSEDEVNGQESSVILQEISNSVKLFSDRLVNRSIRDLLLSVHRTSKAVLVQS